VSSGAISVTVTASDAFSSASQTFTWNVTPQVAFASVADQTNQEGDVASLQVSATGVSGNAVTYSADGLPDGLNIDPNSGIISGTIAVGDAANGPFAPTISATDGTYSGSISFSWNVTSPVTIADVADQTNLEGDAVSVQVSATAASGNAITFTAEGLPNGLSIDANSGVISGTVAVGDSAGGGQYYAAAICTQSLATTPAMAPLL
jgi:hypothetical protein